MGISAGTLVAYAAVAASAASVITSATASKPSAPKIEMPEATDTGKVTEDEAQATAKKRLFRAGIIGTSPTGLGLGDTEPLASARLR